MCIEASDHQVQGNETTWWVSSSDAFMAYVRNGIQPQSLAKMNYLLSEYLRRSTHVRRAGRIFHIPGCRATNGPSVKLGVWWLSEGVLDGDSIDRGRVGSARGS